MKNILLIFLLIGLTSYCFGQQKAKYTLQTADSVAILDMLNQLESLRKLSESNNTSLNGLLTGKELEFKEKYEIVKSNVTNGTETFKLLSTRIIDLKSKNINDDFEKLINDLNNPESQILGFSLNEKVVEMVKVNINPQRTNLGGKIVAAADSITKSPLIRSIPQLTPAISIVTNIISLVRSTGIVKSEIDQTKIKRLENALNKYVQYYIALNNANQGFNYNVIHQIEELGLLQQKLYEQLIVYANFLNYKLPNKADNEKLDIYLVNVFNKFKSDWTKQYFVELETKYTNPQTMVVGYDKILKDISGLKEANNRLEELIYLVNQFEFQYNEYFNILASYHANIEKSLDIAKQNGIARDELIVKQKGEFTKKKQLAIETLIVDINLQELIDNKKTLKYTARVL